MKLATCFEINPPPPTFSFYPKIVLMVFIFFKQTVAVYVQSVIQLGLLNKGPNFCVNLILYIIRATVLYT